MVGTTNRCTSGLFAAVLLVGSVSSWSHVSADSHRRLLEIETGHAVLQVVGEVNNLASTPDAPLGSSQQFGYVSDFEGIDSVFTDPTPANQNETTAMLTFFTDVKTTRVTPHGPFSVVIREGTTTLSQHRSGELHDSQFISERRTDPFIDDPAASDRRCRRKDLHGRQSEYHHQDQGFRTWWGDRAHWSSRRYVSHIVDGRAART